MGFIVFRTYGLLRPVYNCHRSVVCMWQSPVNCIRLRENVGKETKENAHI